MKRRPAWRDPGWRNRRYALFAVMTAVGVVLAGIGWFSGLAAEARSDLTAVGYGLTLIGLSSCFTLLVLSRTQR